MRALQRRLGKQHAVVGDDAHRHAVNPREPGHQRGAVARLEFVEIAAVNNACDDFAHIEWLARVDRNDAVQFARVKQRLNAFAEGEL